MDHKVHKEELGTCPHCQLSDTQIAPKVRWCWHCGCVGQYRYHYGDYWYYFIPKRDKPDDLDPYDIIQP